MLLLQEKKICEAYSMLKGQGVIQEDPVHVKHAVFAASLPPRYLLLIIIVEALEVHFMILFRGFSLLTLKILFAIRKQRLTISWAVDSQGMLDLFIYLKGLERVISRNPFI